MDPFLDRRNSFRTNMTKGDFERAKEKIDDNISLIDSNVRELQNYLFKLGSKRDNPEIIQKA